MPICTKMGVDKDNPLVKYLTEGMGASALKVPTMLYALFAHRARLNSRSRPIRVTIIRAGFQPARLLDLCINHR